MSMNYPDYGVGAWDPQNETYVDYLIRLNDAQQSAGGGVYAPSFTATAPTSAPPAPAVAPAAPFSPTAASPSPAPAAVGGLTPAQLSAQSIIQSTLRQYQLDSPDLQQWARDSIINGSTTDQMLLELYDPSSTPGKVVATMYPELQLRQQNGYRPLSISEAQSSRDQLKQVLHTYLPAGMYDSSAELAQFIGHDKSPSELNDELKMHAADAAEWATAGDRASTVSEMQRLYGVGPSSREITAAYIDPNLAENVIRQHEAAAAVGAQAANTGFGQLDQMQAERLGALGITSAQAQQGFGRLVTDQQLVTPLPGEGNVTPITRNQQLAAAFEGDVAAQQQIDTVRRQRAAVFAGGGGFSRGRGGLEGVGTAPQA